MRKDKDNYGGPTNFNSGNGDRESYRLWWRKQVATSTNDKGDNCGTDQMRYSGKG